MQITDNSYNNSNIENNNPHSGKKKQKNISVNKTKNRKRNFSVYIYIFIFLFRFYYDNVFLFKSKFSIPILNFSFHVFVAFVLTLLWITLSHSNPNTLFSTIQFYHVEWTETKNKLKIHVCIIYYSLINSIGVCLCVWVCIRHSYGCLALDVNLDDYY